ncbi:helix-turn-helix domain-containing protein [Chryseobacterium sp. RG1]|uniref:Helix-turn-helix domain-containing protein n=1 Tax=Chryseobacterium tagetis TaxID=2801334 RepID=A0ABS7ZZ61_9FLAO|nr:helix-turn-helix domain-containing protein [Chryseobacterium tagetis]MCA6065910.1 helix-turn-helix domain-containing protein [Chryseobacterium tagetis]
MRKIYAITAFLWVLFLSAQNVSDSTLSKQISDLYYKKVETADEIIAKGEEILKLSRNDNEISKGYYTLSNGYYKKANYSQSIFFGRKADSLFTKLDKHTDRFMINYYMAAAYNKAGLKDKAYSNLEEAKKIAEQIQNEPALNIMALILETTFLSDEKKYCQNIPIRNEIIKRIEKFQKKHYFESNETSLSVQHVSLSLDYLLCDNLDAAKYQIQQYEKYEKLPPSDRRIDIYYVCKAIINAKENNKEEAKKYFEKAKAIAEENKNVYFLTFITEQRLKYNVDDVTKKNELFEQFFQLKDSINSASVKAISQETKLQNKIVNRQKNYKWIWVSVAGLLLCFSLLFIFLSRKKEEKIRLRFEKIIKEIEKKKDIVTLSENNEMDKNIDTPVADNNSINKSKIISNEKETELLKKIEEFEKGTAFTAKNFTLSNFASILGTNTKYITYLLKEYWAKSFSDYINTLKIKFIIEHLYENPESVKYKISYLCELAGFSSHSHFTKVFTKETGISPSKFISNLKRVGQHL